MKQTLPAAREVPTQPPASGVSPKRIAPIAPRSYPVSATITKASPPATVRPNAQPPRPSPIVRPAATATSAPPATPRTTGVDLEASDLLEVLPQDGPALVRVSTPPSLPARRPPPPSPVTTPPAVALSTMPTPPAGVPAPTSATTAPPLPSSDDLRTLVEDTRWALALLQRTIAELERRLATPDALAGIPAARPDAGVPAPPAPASAVQETSNAPWDGERRRRTVVVVAALSLFLAFFGLISAMVGSYLSR